MACDLRLVCHHAFEIIGAAHTYENANGYVRGEGVGALLLKPLAQAQADGDHIYALIKAAAVNHGGRAQSLTAPNTAAQAELLVRAYHKAGINPDQLGYIETHGTGTKLGDPVEINALKKAFKRLYEERGQVPPNTPHIGLGSVKSHIGHLESAAGISGVLKIVLALRHTKIPGDRYEI